MGGNEIIAKERTPRAPKTKTEPKAKTEAVTTADPDQSITPPSEPEQDASPVTKRGGTKVVEEAEVYDLLYLGNKDPKVIEIDHGRVTHVVTFRRPTPKQPAIAHIECEDCYVHLMNIAGPSPDVPEANVIFMPPAQLKPWLSAKARRDAAREKALQELKQPWKAEQAKRAQRGEDE